MPPPYRGVLFDLFGTLIAFDPSRLPQLLLDGQSVRTSIGALGPLVARLVPGTTLEELWRVLIAVSEEMALARTRDHVELPSRERFRRVLERLGCDEALLPEASILLSRAHMRLVADATTLPPGHAEVLAHARARGRVGLVSNFDDTGTAYDILCRHGILGELDAVVVSEAVGMRKPHPALLRAALHALDLEPGETLFVGDTFAEDVVGAQAAGVDVAWIDAHGSGVPAGATPPRWIVRTLTQLIPILDASMPAERRR